MTPLCPECRAHGRRAACSPFCKARLYSALPEWLRALLFPPVLA